MVTTQTLSFTAMAEKQLRNQIDRSVSRALVDSEYADLLLSDPTIAVREAGCAPQQYKQLHGIHATDLVDFARQAQALFWIVEPRTMPRQNEQLAMVAGR